MNRAKYWSALVLLLVDASACVEDSGGKMLTELSQADIGDIDTIQESNGHQRHIGAPTIAFEDPVTEVDSGGRLIEFGDPTGTAGGGAFTMRLVAELNKCIAVKRTGDLVEIRSCDVMSANWTIELGPNGCLFKNVVFGEYLSGPNGNNPGGKFQLKGKGANGWLQQFNWLFGCPHRGTSG